MKVKIKKLHRNAVIPKYAKPGDAGLDLVAIDLNANDLYMEYRTGLAIEIPEGFIGLIFPRSSISNTAHILANSVGVIDSGYRGEIKIRFKLDNEILKSYGSISMHEVLYKKGDKVAQLIIVPYPSIELEEVEELSSTERGDGGFGSTNK